MVVRVARDLEEKINRKFKGESIKIFELIYSLEKNPKKGKIVGQVGGILVKELKYKGFRFYFIADGYKIKFLDVEDLQNLMMRFVKMSDKRSQQKTIDEIKTVLRNLGETGFNN